MNTTMANEEHNTQCQPHTMKLCDAIHMTSNITPLINILDYTAVDIVVGENDDILGTILSFLDVIKLFQKMPVCKQWKNLCKIVIDQKLVFPRKAFASNQELRNAVSDYTSWQRNPNRVENIATVYGWPIDKWDVSHIQDFSNLFYGIRNFNEYIGSWNVSKGNNMEGMFENASKFDQDISSWNIANVTNMSSMFTRAIAFNQNISSWNVARKLTDMKYMFYEATTFNQDISSWNVSKVTDMNYMFVGATAFNQDISSWNVGRIFILGIN